MERFCSNFWNTKWLTFSGNAFTFEKINLVLILKYLFKMKKILLSIIAILMIVPSVFSQCGFVWGPPGDKFKLQQGGSNGKSYAFIAETNGNKKSLIDSTIHYLQKWGLIKDSTELSSSLKEFGEQSSQFTIGMWYKMGYWRHGLYNGFPTIMEYDMRFEFYENGNVMVVFDNFASLNYVDISTLRKSRQNDSCSVLTPDERKLFKEYQNAQWWCSDNGFAFFRDDEEAKAHEYYIKLKYDINGFYALLEKDIIGCPTKFFATDSTVFKLVQDAVKTDDYSMGGAKYIIPVLQKNLEEGRMFSVPYVLWRRDIKEGFDRYIVEMQNALGAKVTGVAEDGNQTWELVGDKLLPTDPKLRAKLVKKNLDYFTYVEEL